MSDPEPMREPDPEPPATGTNSKGRGCARGCIYLGLIPLTLLLLSLAFGPIHNMRHPRQSAMMQQSHGIALLLFQYANDNDGKYPEGNSSTEVFQKLIDGKYASDPTIFYLPLPGKTKAVPGQLLKPENVGWDVTCCLDPNDPDGIPVVFVTGYKVTYAPGADAILSVPRHFSFALGSEDVRVEGIAVAYKRGNATWMPLPDPTHSGVIPNFIDPADKFPAGKTYRQLTPDGPFH